MRIVIKDDKSVRRTLIMTGYEEEVVCLMIRDEEILIDEMLTIASVSE